MIRRSVLNINYANKGKRDTLDLVVSEMTKAVNLFIDELWQRGDFSSKYVDFKIDTWLSARLQQSLGKQALEIVKSQRKNQNKTKPIFSGNAFNLDSRFVDFQYDINTFDIWIRLSSIGNKIILKLPSRGHKHYNKYKDWNKSKSIRLLKRSNGYFIEVFFEKESPELKQSGKVIGVDCGYKKLLVDSEGNNYDDGLEKCYEKISRKKRGSKSFKRALAERDNLTNQSLNKLNLTDVKEIVVEDLNNVKKGNGKNKKRKMTKKFMNKLQRWSYPKVLGKLVALAEQNGTLLTKRNPAYTSQKCSMCGVICKSNRQGQAYKCTCGNKMDADLNAAINLSHMGVYSPHALN
jgi:IS605 OrfB family transposase